MIKRLVALMIVLLLVTPAAHGAQAASLAARHKPHPGKLQSTPRGALAGTLTSISGAVLTVTSAQNVAYTVAVAPTTRIVRLYNGLSHLDELSPGDALLVKGPMALGNTIAATWIKDQSIQRAYTRLVGLIGGVNGSVVTTTVTADASSAQAPFGLGQILTLDIGAATKVVSPTTAGAVTVLTGAAALAALAANVSHHATVLGVYNRVQRAFTTVDRVVLARAAAQQVVHEVTGAIVGVPALAAPTTLTLQSERFGLVSVTIAAAPAVSIVRRFDGHSALDELSPGDNLTVQGAFVDAANTTFGATRIKDWTIQEAATRAVLQVSAAGFNAATSSFAGVVLHDVESVRAPFDEGAAVTVVVGSATKILIPAAAPARGVAAGTASAIQAGQIVTVLGVYNRQRHAFIVTPLVRIHA